MGDNCDYMCLYHNPLVDNNTQIGWMEFMCDECIEWDFEFFENPNMQEILQFLFWNVTSYKSSQHKYRLRGEFENKVIPIARIVTSFWECSRKWMFEWETWVDIIVIINMHFPLYMNCPRDSPWWKYCHFPLYMNCPRDSPWWKYCQNLFQLHMIQ